MSSPLNEKALVELYRAMADQMHLRSPEHAAFLLVVVDTHLRERATKNQKNEMYAMRIAITNQTEYVARNMNETFN